MTQPRIRLADSAMKERSKQQLLAAELVHANQYGQGCKCVL